MCDSISPPHLLVVTCDNESLPTPSVGGVPGRPSWLSSWEGSLVCSTLVLLEATCRGLRELRRRGLERKVGEAPRAWGSLPEPSCGSLKDKWSVCCSKTFRRGSQQEYFLFKVEGPIIYLFER